MARGASPGSQLSAHADLIRSSEGVTTLLRDLIHERTGLYYDNGHRDMFADKLAPLAFERGFRSFLDYYYLLKYDAEAVDEWGRVLDALSVQETYFWREMDQVRAIVGEILPRDGEAFGERPLRIWSVPCATGEEPLTLAMALDEAGWFGRLPIEIHASDASPAALAKARRGVYRERSFRSLPSGLREKYFTTEADGWRIRPDLHRRITWSQVNLAREEEAARLATARIILCRNLFIYFSEDSIRRTLRTFAARMPSPGYLCVGVSESLLKLTSDFDLQEIGGAFVYVKR